jgi:primase-polymerase (primpol)-like protein
VSSRKRRYYRRLAPRLTEEKFERLWAGDARAYRSRSEADLALCAMLAYWADSNPRRVEELFYRSGLVRPKWRERQDYRRRTIERAIASLPNSHRRSGVVCISEWAD